MKTGEARRAEVEAAGGGQIEGQDPGCRQGRGPRQPLGGRGRVFAAKEVESME